jgi:hypothetical protein
MISPNLRVTVVGDKMTYEGLCDVTKETYKVTVPKAGVEAWLSGMHIQDAMPGVSPDDREFLMSGISPAGWDRIFKDEDDTEAAEMADLGL